jgi:hypothetical protein
MLPIDRFIIIIETISLNETSLTNNNIKLSEF